MKTGPEQMVEHFTERMSDHPYGERDFIRAFAKLLVEDDSSTAEELRTQIIEYLDPMED